MVVRVLQGLLAERVPIRNMRTIVETLAEHAARTPGPGSVDWPGPRRPGSPDRAGHRRLGAELPVITLEPDLERLLPNSLARQRGATRASSRDWRSVCSSVLAEAARRQEGSGEPAVLLVPPQLRQTLARFMRVSVPACTCWPGTRYRTTGKFVW